MAAPVYKTGTVSIASGTTTLTLTGGTFGGTVRAGDVVYRRPVDAGPPIGVIDSITNNLELELTDAYGGTSLVDEDYIIVRGYAWSPFAVPNEIFTELATSLAGAGLVGVTDGEPDPLDGRDKDIRVDPTARVMYQKRAGQWHIIMTVAQTNNPVGPWTGDPVTKTALVISTGDVAIDFDLGAEAPDGAAHFALTLSADAELQLPTNVIAGSEIQILLIGGGAGNDITFASGISAPGVAAAVDTAAGALTNLRMVVDAVSGSTATAATVEEVTFALNDFVEHDGFNFISNQADNVAEPKIVGGVPESTDYWTWRVHDAGPISAFHFETTVPEPTDGADGDIWFKITA